MTNKEFMAIINADPVGVKDSEDGSYKFIPISVIEAKLDEVFEGAWSWDFDREIFGKGYAIGKGTLRYFHPALDVWITKSGTAAVSLTKEVTMDYPLLEALTILSAAKKIGKAFGRDLNRDRDDVMPAIQVEKEENEADAIFATDREALRAFEFQEEAQEYLNNSAYKNHVALKAIVNSKPLTPTD